MLRKSHSNKKEILSWFKNEETGAYITLKDRDTNWDFIITKPINYIKNKAIYSSEMCVGAVETKLAPENIRNVIFVNETAMRICEWKIGDNVVFKGSETFVRIVWPLSELVLQTWMLPKEAVSNSLSSTHEIEISKLTQNVPDADQITLKSRNEINLKSFQKDVTNVIKSACYNNIYSIGSPVEITFFNKILLFNVSRIKSSIQSSDDLLKLNDLKLDDKYYRVTSNTRFTIDQTVPDYQIRTENEVAFGLDDVFNELKLLMDYAFGKITTTAKNKITRAALLYGPSGCGKSLICRILGNSSNYSVVYINSSDIFSKYYGESESNLNSCFDQVLSNYPNPTLLIVEELKNMCPKRTSSNSSDQIQRITTLFGNLLDMLHSKQSASKCFLIATVDNPDNLNEMIRRSGRLDCEIEIPIPNPTTRLEILKYLLKNESRISENDIEEIAKITHGFVGADLISLITKSLINASQRGTKFITVSDINTSLTYIKPSAMREVLIESPNIKWDDIGGMHDLKFKLKQSIEWPITHPEIFKRLGIRPPQGVLMFGPPGCSKTLIAKALATESKLNFLSIKGPELFSMWVGESERAVRDLFKKARQVSPSIIFFDEIDAIGGARSADNGSSVKERVLAQILTEIDGVNALNDVIIVAATNRPDLIDKALLRPGRIDRIIYVPLPDIKTRQEIIRIKLSQMVVANDVNIEELADATNGYSGAEIHAVCNEAALKALEENVNALEVNKSHFVHAFNVVLPRTSKSMLELYEKYLKEL